MIRALHELKELTQETRLHLFAMRKVYQRGSVPDKLRARFKSRLFLIKGKASEVALALREATNLTGAQVVLTRREMGFVRGAIRECERYLSLPSTTKAPVAIPAEDLGWLDLTAGAEVENLPELVGPPAEDWDFLEVVVAPVEEVGPELTGPVTAGLAHCPVCGDPDPADSRACPACGVAYHRECWEYYGGCAIYGCRAAVS